MSHTTSSDPCAPMQPVPDRRYVPALDGLRAVSIVLVLLAHLGLGGIVPGGLGVTVFFFISGLLITRLLLAEQAGPGVALGNFFLRRLARLYPALLAMVVVGGAAFALAGGTIRPGQVAAALFYWANYALLAGHFADPAAAVHPYNILWSLAVEEHFYLLFPLAVVLLAQARARFIATIVAVLLAVLAWRLALFQRCPDAACVLRLADHISYATDTRLDSILYGALLAVVIDSPWARLVLRVLNSPASGAAGLLLLLASLAARGEQFRLVERFSVQGLALLLGAGWLLLSPHAGQVRRMLGARPLRWLGRLSYSLYLWHWVVIACATAAAPTRMAALAAGLRPALVPFALGLAALSLLAACASWYGIETPMLRVRRRLGSGAAETPAGAAYRSASIAADPNPAAMQ